MPSQNELTGSTHNSQLPQLVNSGKAHSPAVYEGRDKMVSSLRRSSIAGMFVSSMLIAGSPELR